MRVRETYHQSREEEQEAKDGGHHVEHLLLGNGLVFFGAFCHGGFLSRGNFDAVFGFLGWEDGVDELLDLDNGNVVSLEVQLRVLSSSAGKNLLLRKRC